MNATGRQALTTYVILTYNIPTSQLPEDPTMTAGPGPSLRLRSGQAGRQRPSERAPLRNTIRLAVLAAALLGLLAASASAQATKRLMLSGTGSDSTVSWDFRVSGGRQSGRWMTIPVPSNWEMQGFGTYHYSNDWSPEPAPDSIGEYRHSFAVPAGWNGQHVDIVFGASMTDTDVRINGVSAGPVHQWSGQPLGQDGTTWRPHREWSRHRVHARRAKVVMALVDSRHDPLVPAHPGLARRGPGAEYRVRRREAEAMTAILENVHLHLDLRAPERLVEQE